MTRATTSRPWRFATAGRDTVGRCGGGRVEKVRERSLRDSGWLLPLCELTLRTPDGITRSHVPLTIDELDERFAGLKATLPVGEAGIWFALGAKNGLEGIRTKTSRATSPSSTALAKPASRPQSIVTKFVAEGSGSSPLSRAMSPIRFRDSATSALTFSSQPVSPSTHLSSLLKCTSMFCDTQQSTRRGGLHALSPLQH